MRAADEKHVQTKHFEQIDKNWEVNICVSKSGMTKDKVLFPVSSRSKARSERAHRGEDTSCIHKTLLILLFLSLGIQYEELCFSCPRVHLPGCFFGDVAKMKLFFFFSALVKIF